MSIEEINKNIETASRIFKRLGKISTGDFIPTTKELRTDRKRSEVIVTSKKPIPIPKDIKEKISNSEAIDRSIKVRKEALELKSKSMIDLIHKTIRAYIHLHGVEPNTIILTHVEWRALMLEISEYNIDKYFAHKPNEPFDPSIIFGGMQIIVRGIEEVE